MATVMVRNFTMENLCPPRPTRSCRKKTGPSDVSLISTAMMIQNGSVTSNAAAAPMISVRRLTIRSHRVISGGATSSSGRPERSVSRDLHETSSKPRGTKEILVKGRIDR